MKRGTSAQIFCENQLIRLSYEKKSKCIFVNIKIISDTMKQNPTHTHDSNY